MLVNFGSTVCAAPTQPSFSLIKNPLSGTPLVLANCSMSPQLPDYFSVFIAYNPSDNQLYIADIRTGVQSRIWKLNIGLPGKIACPASIPTTPTFTHSYVSNNFEFDNNGDLWSFSNYNASLGRCNMDKFDVATGAVLNTRTLQFPAGNYPTTIFSGDLCILPNGRMFATLGDNPSRLYEILNYSSTSGNATAVFLTIMPKNCYGIAYLNGELEITGSDLTNQCYYFRYAIANNTLGPQTPFQNGQAPIDNTSFTPALGTTKRLLSAVKVNANTADITYEVYVRNMGNVILNEINVTEDLGKVFGAANVSNVTASFVPGANQAGLTLNPSFNGTTNTSLLNAGQSLPNQRLTNTNYFFKVQVSCRVTQLQPGLVYLNSVIGTATINNDVDRIIITDSSNNGPQDVVDPNNDGNASGLGENVPTPFDMSLLPVKFLRVGGSFSAPRTATIQWSVATPTENADRFEVECSVNGTVWTTVGRIPITHKHQGAYSYTHADVPPGNLYYRIRQTDKDGAFIYSAVVVLRQAAAGPGISIYPNPVRDQLFVALPGQDMASLVLYDAAGRVLVSQPRLTGTSSILMASLPNGIYLLSLQDQSGRKTTQKIVVKH